MNEKLTIYDEKMTKTLNNLNAELVTIRAGECICAGGAHDSDSAVGEEHAQGD